MEAHLHRICITPIARPTPLPNQPITPLLQTTRVLALLPLLNNSILQKQTLALLGIRNFPGPHSNGMVELFSGYMEADGEQA